MHRSRPPFPPSSRPRPGIFVSAAGLVVSPAALDPDEGSCCNAAVVTLPAVTDYHPFRGCARLTWALIKKIYEIDPFLCPDCRRSARHTRRQIVTRPHSVPITVRTGTELPKTTVNVIRGVDDRFSV